MESLPIDKSKIFMAIIEEIGTLMSLSEFCNKVLRIIKKIVPFHFGHFIFYDTENNLLPVSYRYNINDNIHSEYLNYYRYKDDFMKNALNTHQPKRSTDIMDYTEWNKTEYFNDFLLRNHFFYFTISDIHYNGKLMSSLSLIRNKKSKDFSTDELIALKTLSPFIANHMYKLIVIEKYEKSDKDSIIHNINKSKIWFDFTDREFEIIDYIIKGRTNDEISDLLYISKETVKKHINNIFKKTNVRNRTEILAKFLGLI